MSMPSLQVDLRLPLEHFELEVAFTTEHTVTGVFGASGSGKSSLLESIAGLRRHARGTVRQGDDVWQDSAARVFQRPEQRGVGYVPQDGLLFPHRTVRENLLAGQRRARERGLPFEQLLASVVELLDLGPLLARRAPNLSGGERQRVALGRALCSGPRLLLLDEPLAALDLPLRRRLLVFLRRIKEEFAIPWLLVSHDPVEMQALCDDMLVLSAGRLIARGRPDEVLTDPEVYGLAEERGFENVVPCEFAAANRVRLLPRRGESGSGVEIVTGAAPRGVGSGPVLLGLAAHEIMIATGRPEGLSARNVLAGRIVRQRPIGPIELVTVELEGSEAELTAEVTDTTMEAMGLTIGDGVHVVFKATSCRLFVDDRS